MPVSKKRKKKRAKSPAGPPLSKKEIAARKRKLTKRQILIYVFSALIILSFALSFVVGFGGGHTGGVDASSDSGNILNVPVSGQEDTTVEDTDGTHNAMPSDSDTDN